MFLILLLFSLAPAISSDKAMGFGRRGSENHHSCFHTGSIDAVPGKTPEVRFACEVPPTKYVSAVTLRLKGKPSPPGSITIDEGSIGAQRVGVRIWGEKGRHLDYAVWFFYNYTVTHVEIEDYAKNAYEIV